MGKKTNTILSGTNNSGEEIKCRRLVHLVPSLHNGSQSQTLGSHVILLKGTYLPFPSWLLWGNWRFFTHKIT